MNHETQAAQTVLDVAVQLSEGSTKGEVAGQAMASLFCASAVIARDTGMNLDEYLSGAIMAFDHITQGAK